MPNTVIGRDKEKALLSKMLTSKQAEFMAIYGRRRVGKTYLVRQFFETNPHVQYFESTGVKKAPMKEQIGHFSNEISRVFYNSAPLMPAKNWNEVFAQLTKALNNTNPKKKTILFLDEFPWMATKNSRLLNQLEYYWNRHWSKNQNLILIICGSSASWIIEKIVHNKAGLHNRITQDICLQPFDLLQTKHFLKSQSIKLNNKQITDIYMAMGGIPYYLSKLEGNLSATQLIEELAFSKSSFFMDEFDKLFASLFDEPDELIEIVRTIASRRYGINQKKLLDTLPKSLRGKSGLQKLKTLENSSFITSFIPHFHRRKGVYYRVIDEYCMFYFHWIEPIKNTLLKQNIQQGYWSKIKTQPAWYSWAGLTFEAICYKHIGQIHRALSLSPTAIPGTWRYSPRKADQEGAQIDLLFDRDDDAITICEIKYSDKPFVITKSYAQQLQKKVDVFRKITRTKKQIFIVLITANGLKDNDYSEDLVDGVVTISDFFR